ncbi:MAG: hypothetical protein JNK82_29085 [Myxococcaceae bacterium]|nr:hypothetical protein [Myxococcaceae bacterium]
MRRVGLLALAALSCSAQPQLCFTKATRSDFTLGLVGEPVTARVRSPLFCVQAVKATAVVTVLDPNGVSVDIDGEPTRSAVHRPEGGFDTDVSFVPTLPGTYRVVARFEPGLGMVQDAVVVAEDRRDAGPDIVVTSAPQLLLGCSHVDVTDAGHVICLSPTTALFSRDGGVLAELEGPAVRDGQVYWGLGAKLSRRVERDDGALEHTSTASGSCGIAAPFEGGVLCDEGTGVRGFGWFPDAGLSGAFSIETQVKNLRSVWASGRLYLAAGDRPDDSFGLSSQYCVGVFNDSHPCARGLSESFNDPRFIAVSRGGIWAAVTEEAEPRSLLRVDGTLTELRLALPPGWQELASQPRWDTSPVVISPSNERWYVFEPSPAEVTLQRFPELTLISATTRWVTFSSGSTVMLFRR